MSVTRDSLTRTSIHALFVSALLAQMVLLALSLDVVGLRGPLFAAGFGVAALVARRRPRLAGAGVLVVGVPVVGALIIEGGGSAGFVWACAPMVALAAWVWLGRRWGLVVMVVLVACMVAGDRGAAPAGTTSQRQALYVALTLLAAAFIATVMGALRRSADLAEAHAADAAHAAREARAADEARDRLLAAVNQHLRTPLDSILGDTTRLLRDAEPHHREDLARIAVAGRQLRGLVEDMLVAGAREVEITLEGVEVGALAREAVAITEALAAASGNRVVVTAPRGGAWIRSDATRVRQILLNLITNAHKYTRAGEVRISVVGEAGQVRCEVRDTGVGIPSDKLHLLFQPFAQLHEGTERRPGVGLGLALSQRLAARLGGRIEAVSTPGEGSTFTVYLPATSPGGPRRARGFASWVTATDTPAPA